MYISDCIGVRWVGLVLMTYGVCSGVGGFVSGRMVKHVPHHLITYLVSAIHLVTLIFLLFWERTSLHYMIFIVPAILGVCEGSINCIATSESSNKAKMVFLFSFASDLGCGGMLVVEFLPTTFVCLVLCCSILSQEIRTSS